METPGISPAPKILKEVKYARTTSLLLMSMVTLVPHSMMPTQMVAVTTIPQTSMLLLNAVSVVEAKTTGKQSFPRRSC